MRLAPAMIPQLGVVVAGAVLSPNPLPVIGEGET
jgi:hypothetical protein